MIANAITTAFRIDIKGNLHPLERDPSAQQEAITHESYNRCYISVSNKEADLYVCNPKLAHVSVSAYLQTWNVCHV